MQNCSHGCLKTRALLPAEQIVRNLPDCPSQSIAFAAYASEFMTANPARVSELFQYIGLIASASKDFKPSAWLNTVRSQLPLPGYSHTILTMEKCQSSSLVIRSQVPMCVSCTVTWFWCSAPRLVSAKCNFCRSSWVQVTSPSSTD